MAEVRLFALVLAAGSSSRFGAPKQLETWRGEPLAAHAVRLAESVCGARTVLVAGHEWRAVVEACSPLEGFFVNFPGYGAGMSASIASGIRAIAGAADGALLLLADQPLVTQKHLRELIGVWTRSPGAVVATGYSGTRGPPVIFPARTFGRLSTLAGDRGAREVLVDEGPRVLELGFADAAVDVDRPADLDALR